MGFAKSLLLCSPFNRLSVWNVSNMLNLKSILSKSIWVLRLILVFSFINLWQFRDFLLNQNIFNDLALALRSFFNFFDDIVHLLKSFGHFKNFIFDQFVSCSILHVLHMFLLQKLQSLWLKYLYLVFHFNLKLNFCLLES